MITLDVADYCHDCSGFEPVANKIYNTNGDAFMTKVECERAKHCHNLMRYLERQYKKQEVDHVRE